MKNSTETIQRDVVPQDYPQWVNFADNKKLATEVINSLEDKVTYTSQFLNGMYYGVLITLNAEEEKVKVEGILSQQLSNYSFFKRVGVAFQYVFHKRYKSK